MPGTRAVRDLWGCQLEPNRRSNWRTVCGHCLRLRTEHTVSTKQGEHKGDGMLGMIATYSSYNLCTVLAPLLPRTMMDQGRLPTLDTGGNTANRRSVMIHATSTTTTTKLSSRTRAVLKGTATAATAKLKTTLTDVAEQWNSVGVAGHQELRKMGTVSVRSQCLPPFNCESINSCFCVLPSKHASIFTILLSVLYDIRTSELLSSRPAGPANPEGQAPPIHYPPTNSHTLLTSIKRITYKLHGVAFPLNP